jgi:putative peptidoglycan lipid II flippase
MSRAAIILGFLNLLAAGAGFFREATIAYRLGASASSDAFAITILLIDSIALVSFLGLSTYMMVPILVPLLREDRSSGYALTETVALWIVAGSALIAVPLVVTPGLIARMLGPEFSAAQIRYLSLLLRLSALAIPLVGLTGIMAGLLQASERYSWTALGRLTYSLTIGLALLLATRRDALLVGGIGITLGAAAQTAIHAVGLHRCGWRLTKLPSLSHQNLKEAWEFGLPGVAVLVCAYVLMGNLQRAVASGLPEGSLASITYGQRTASLMTTFSTAVMTVAVTQMTLTFSDSGMSKATINALVRHVLDPLAWLTPIAVALYCSSEPITHLLLDRGAMTPAAIELSAACLRWLSVAFVPALVLGILMRTYAPFRRPWRAAGIAAIWTVTSVVSTWLLLPRLGAMAVPAGYLIGSTSACTANLLDLARLTAHVNWGHLFTGAARVLIPALVAVEAAVRCNLPAALSGHGWNYQFRILCVRSAIAILVCLAGYLILREPVALGAYYKGCRALSRISL